MISAMLYKNKKKKKEGTLNAPLKFSYALELDAFILEAVPHSW